MFCRMYLVLIVICITCLFIFTALDSEKRYFVSFNYRNSKANNDSYSNFSSFETEGQTGSPPSSLGLGLEAGINNKLLVANSKYLLRMENNNSNGLIMSPASPEKKKVPEIKISNSNNSIVKDSSATNGDVIDMANNSTDKYAGQFNIKLLNEQLKRCIREGDHEVDMDAYISIFQQLYKFFCMLGSLFGFIGSDVKTKIEILQSYRDGENSSHYETVEKMLEYEKSTEYIYTNKESSGSRTFLRLHRSLIFVSKFLNKMDSISDQDGISRICKEAYSQTLAKFHPWLIQKGAGIAMLGLPTKKDLIAKVCANGLVENGEIIPIMHNVIKLTGDIYDQCEKLYTEHDLHGLP